MEESDLKLNRMGNSKNNKLKATRFDNYNSKFDVSMNERLIHRFSQRRGGRHTQQNSIDASSVHSNGGDPNNSIDHDNIQEKLAKMTETLGDQDFSKIRKEAQWRIWLGEEEDDEIEENPLISPWKWNGTMQYIHLDWLKKWLDSKIHTKLTDFTLSYNWKNLVWELWGERLKDKYIVNGKETYILDYFRPYEGSYLILESYTNTPHKTIHVLISNKK